MKVLVTGGGLLGSEIAHGLVAAGHDVSVLDLRAPAGTPPWTVAVGDIRDFDAVSAAVAGADVVVHTAALHHIHMASFTPTDFVNINVTGTFNVLEAAHASSVRGGS